MTKTTWVDDTTYATATQLNRIEDQLVVICTSGTRPTGVEGQCIWETDNDIGYVYDGSGWVPFFSKVFTSWSPTWTNLTVGNGTLSTKYEYIGPKHIAYHIDLTFGSTSSISGSVDFTLPATAADADEAGNGGQCWFEESGGTYYVGRTYRSTTTKVLLGTHLVSGTYPSIQSLSATIPFTWGTSDKLIVNGSFRTA